MAGDAFQKIKNSVNRGITTISVKTSSSLEKSKIKVHVDSLEKEIQKLFLSIGEDAYSIWNSNGTDYQKLIDKFVIVNQKKAEIEQLTVALNSIDVRDNQILGRNQEYSQEQSTVNKIVCTNCGSQYETPINFCRKCGHSLQNN